MKITEIDKTYSKIRRYRQILGVFIKYGFDDIITRLGIEYYINLGRKIIKRPAKRKIEKLSSSHRLRLAFEELGPTFIKLGQILSLRADIIPAEYANEFRKLLDEAAPFSTSEAINIIESELGKPLKENFLSFDEKPIAAASIAQVYKAVLLNKKNAAVKVQRPNVKKIIQTDLSILYDLSKLIESNIPEGKLYDPKGIVEEFSNTIIKEIDFLNEGRNSELFKKNFEGDSTVYVHQIYWNLSTPKVLTMDYIDGTKISNFDKLQQLGFDKKIIAENGANSILRQIFEFGFFHADPHPGNIFVIENNVIAPVDYGMMGRIDDETMDHISNILIGVVRKDVDKIIKSFINMGIIESNLNIRKLKIDITEFMDQYYEVPLNRLDIEKIINRIMNIHRKHRIKFPSNIVIMGKALVTSEAVGRKLNPDFDMMSLLKPYVEKMMLQRFSFSRQSKNFIKLAEEFHDLLRVFPSDLREIMRKIKSGDISINFEHKGLEKLITEMDKSSNRISFSLIIAALIVGSSIIMQTGLGPFFLGFPVIGVIGYLIAGVLGMWLVIAILKSGRL